MKHKKLTIALVASTVAALILVATLSVYAYFTTRVYVYTDDGKEVAHVGMNLQLLFGKLTNVETGTDLGIPSYNVVDGDGNIVTLTASNGQTYWANVAGEGQCLHYNDGVTDKTTHNPRSLGLCAEPLYHLRGAPPAEPLGAPERGLLRPALHRQ